MNTFLLEIITPERQAYSETVDRVSLPTYTGRIEVLAHHMALFAALTEGEVKISTGNKEVFLAIGGGFLEVTKTKALILVSAALHAHELNESEIIRAQAQAREAIGRKVTGEEMHQAQMLLRRSTIQMNLFRKFRRKSTSISTGRA